MISLKSIFYTVLIYDVGGGEKQAIANAACALCLSSAIK